MRFGDLEEDEDNEKEATPEKKEAAAEKQTAKKASTEKTAVQKAAAEKISKTTNIESSSTSLRFVQSSIQIQLCSSCSQPFRDKY